MPCEVPLPVPKPYVPEYGLLDIRYTFPVPPETGLPESSIIQPDSVEPFPAPVPASKLGLARMLPGTSSGVGPPGRASAADAGRTVPATTRPRATADAHHPLRRRVVELLTIMNSSLNRVTGTAGRTT